MAASRCQRCSQLPPPPPPIFSLEPPPKLLSIDLHCTSRFEHKKIISSSLSPSIASHLTIIFTLCIIILISIGTLLFIKKQLIKRRSDRQRHSLSVNFNHHQNWRKTIPLLSDSSCSDQLSNTPTNDYRFGIDDDLHHDYEQISYCLIYCRQCGNYHQTSCTCH